MEGSSDLKAALWGAVAGAAALAAVAFLWTGWVTQRTAEAKARQLAPRVVASASAEMCVDKFRQQADVAASLTQLKASSASQQGVFIENGGWATLPGTSSPDPAAATACAALLVAEP